MKQLITALAILLSTSAVAQPDKDWWACQPIKSAGLEWVNGQWSVTGFRPEPPFVLVSDGNGTLTRESVAKPLDTYAELIECKEEYKSRISCTSGSGNLLFFDPEAAMGGISQLYGTTYMDTERDTVSVDAFECTKG